MKRRLLIGMAALAAACTVALFVLVGCGGGGGPISPPAGNANGGVSSAFQALLPPAQKSASFVGASTCLNCHNDTYHENWKDTVHFQNNVGCEQCHGPGSVHVADETKAKVKLASSSSSRTRDISVTDILTFPNITSPTVCAQCHGALADDYLGSPHAQFVADPVNSGSTNCVRCHSAQLRTPLLDVPLEKYEVDPTTPGAMTASQIDTNINALTAAQLSTYASETQQTATCSTCHDPHTQTPVAVTNDSGVSANQVRHATFNTDTTNVNPGSTAANYTTENQICAQCHNARGGGGSDANVIAEGKSGRQSFHEGPQYNMLMGLSVSLADGTVVQTSSHAQRPDQCAGCHMPQVAYGSSHTFTTNYDTSCSPCHSTADAAARAAALKSEITNDLLTLLTRMQSWSQSTYNDPDLWDYSSNITALGKTPPNQANIPIQMSRARHNYHFVVQDNSFGVHNAPYVRQLIDYANSNLDALGVGPGTPPPSKAVAAQVIQRQLALDRAAARIGGRGRM